MISFSITIYMVFYNDLKSRLKKGAFQWNNLIREKGCVCVCVRTRARAQNNGLNQVGWHPPVMPALGR